MADVRTLKPGAFYFQFDGHNYWNIITKHVKFCMMARHKHADKFYMKYVYKKVQRLL